MSQKSRVALTLSERIELELRRKELNWARLANLIGVSEGAIHLWRKRGWLRLRVEHAFLIADVLEIDPRLFIGEDPGDE